MISGAREVPLPSWLRLVLIFSTVGGGTTGAVLTFQAIFDSGRGSGFVTIMLIFFLLYVAVIASGLAFAINPVHVRPVFMSMVVQVVWFSSPILAYKFATGFYVVVSLGEPDPGGAGVHLGWEAFLGGTHRFAMGADSPWRIGVNLVALAMCVLLWRVRRATLGTGFPEQKR